MNCMKCGREIALGQVFCKECLADMDQYPIKPGTPVPLFAKPEAVQPKRVANQRKQKKPEEQIAGLKRWIFSLAITLLVTIMCFSVALSIMSHQLNEARNAKAPGQNYSTMDGST